MSENLANKIFEHKWLDPQCVELGCKSLFLVAIERKAAVAEETAEAYRSAVTAAGGHTHHGDHTPMTPAEHVANLVGQYKSRIDELECTLDDEEASGVETHALLKAAEARIAELEAANQRLRGQAVQMSVALWDRDELLSDCLGYVPGRLQERIHNLSAQEAK